MADIVISKYGRQGKRIVSSVSTKGTRWMEVNMDIRVLGVECQITIDAEGEEEIIKLMQAEGLEVDSH